MMGDVHCHLGAVADHDTDRVQWPKRYLETGTESLSDLPRSGQPLKLGAEKVIDVDGLYLSPPDNAMVLCVDEKT